MEDQTLTDILNDSTADHVESGILLREEVRQMTSNALDMTSVTVDHVNGHAALRIEAPTRIGRARFAAVVSGITAYVEAKAFPRWTVERLRVGPGAELVAYLVFSHCMRAPADTDEVLDFLGGLSVWPDD
jgi:hypothetical protein